MAVCSARAHAPCLLVLTLLSQLLAIHGQSGYPLEVIELSDSDFEARTQAATGQTTGHWCVLFYSPTVAATKLLALWNNLAEKEDKQEIYAAVNLHDNPLLAQRFGITSKAAMVLFKSGGLYAYPGDLAAVKSAEFLRSWVSEGHLHQPLQQVPGELGATIRIDTDKHPMLIPALVGIWGALAFLFVWKMATKKPKGTRALNPLPKRDMSREKGQ